MYLFPEPPLHHLQIPTTAWENRTVSTCTTHRLSLTIHVQNGHEAIKWQVLITLTKAKPCQANHIVTLFNANCKDAELSL